MLSAPRKGKKERIKNTNFGGHNHRGFAIVPLCEQAFPMSLGDQKLDNVVADVIMAAIERVK